MFIQSKFFKNSALVLLGLQASQAWAQQEKPASLLDEVVVTTSKYPQKQSQTGKVVTIISPEIIQKSSGKTIGELLNQQVGLTVIGSQNNLGTNQDIYLRGAGSGYTLILLNGTPIYDPSSSSNAFDINLIPLDQVERIEILKGGQSTLYGSDAIAGVINIITHKQQTQPIKANIAVAGGSYDTYKGNVGLSGHANKTNYSVQYGYLTSKGFSAAKEPTGVTGYDRDGINQHNFNAFVEQQLTQKLTLKLNGAFNRYKTDLDAGAFKDEKDYTFTSKNVLWGGGLVYELGKGKLTVNYNQNTTERKYLDDSVHVEKDAFNKFSDGFYKGNAQLLEAYANFGLNNHVELLVGAENRWQNTDQTYLSISAYGPYESPAINSSTAKIKLFSGYSSLTFKNLGIFGAELGGRYNNHSIYGDNFTYNINPYILVANQLKVFGTYSSSFKAPSLYQLFSPYGTPDLKPEVGKTIEFGSQFFTSDHRGNVRVVYFDRKVKDVIAYISINQDPWGRYVNFNEQKDHGLEVDGQYSIGKATLIANYTYVDGKVLARMTSGKDTTYANLFRRPKHSFNASLSYQILKSWSAQASVRSVSKAASGPYDDAAVTLGSYTTVDVYQEYRFNNSLKVFLDIKNITNKEYYDIPGYNTRRRNFMIGASYQF